MTTTSSSSSSVCVEIVRTKGARAGKPAARPFRFIVRRYRAEGGFVLLSSGCPFATEEKAQKEGEKAAARHRLDFDVVLCDLAEGKEFPSWRGTVSELLQANPDDDAVREAVEALRAGSEFRDLGGGAAFRTRLRRAAA